MAADVPLQPRATVGFVGLGRMGLPMASRLVAAGFDVHGYDVARPARDALARAGGRVAERPVAAAAGAAAVLLMLPGSAEVEQVLLGEGLLDACAGATVVIDLGSSDPERTRELAARAVALGLAYVDAPVSGGVAGAGSGSLTVMAGGEAAALAHVDPLLRQVGERILHVGPAGAGHALKALNNLLSATTLLASSEALEVGRRFGLDPETMLEAINASSGRSFSTEVKLSRFVIPEDHSSGFALRLMLKDMRIALGLAERLQVPMRLGAASAELWAAAADALDVDADHTEIGRWAAARGTIV